MANLSIKTSHPVQTLPAAPPQATAPQKTNAAKATPAVVPKDEFKWSSASTGSRVKAATIESFKETAIPYTLGGALAPPLAGAALGGFIGLFNGDPIGTAKLGLKAGARYMHYGAAAGLGISGLKSGVVGTVVGTAADKKAAVTHMATLTAVVGILNAEKPEDLIDVAGNTAYDATLAGRVFDKAEARLQQAAIKQ